MKKVLFASTALVMTAGVAAAEVTLSGSGNMGVKYDGTSTELHNEIGLSWAGSATTDSGITFSAGQTISNEGAFDGAYTVSMAYEGLTVTMGNDTSSAADVGGIGDIGFDGLGVDDVAEGAADEGDSDVVVSYSFGDITAAVSTGDDGADTGIGITGTMGGVSFALGLDDDSGTNSTYLGLGYTAGEVAMNAHYETDGTDNAYGIHVAYTTGDVTVSAAYASADNATSDAYGIGFAYDLGGATLAGGFGQDGDGDNVADLGVSFSF